MNEDEKRLRHQIGVSEQNARLAKASGRNPKPHEQKARLARAELRALAGA